MKASAQYQNADMTEEGHLWAPEVHRVDGKW